MRGAWIETNIVCVAWSPDNSSPPVRGAWIETSLSANISDYGRVASREGGVD